ncbi:Gfo/Idh/MocA family oxidoreductase [Rhizobium sp. 32-5/1]|uniref:Gfo/Idh/MocA family protein n=1 Tax=Rhizobium sp. 32-5/1 TaxID=3019602 RepID=UPI00240D4AE0|nr:Gfo/Idh/MocA family oxidoreductase [Rhizobium sp. 32-5/1]WEZ82890.1 Gfo/Idh/MocA family oxidoreductase [Rhizobium sp. 32-5/1]
MIHNDATSRNLPLRWGLIGTGAIATVFAQDIQLVAGAKLIAVCSRHISTARDFSARFADIRAYDDASLMARDVDAVYIASTNVAHYEQARSLLTAGKPVLVEKPLVTSSHEARALAALAYATQTFAMEAMWTAYLPAIDHVRTLLKNGVIGRITGVSAELAFKKPFDPGSRFFSQALGGGALYDLGIYPIALMLTLFGSPKMVSGQWTAASTGVDMSAHGKMHYAGFDAAFDCGFDRNGGNRLVISGETGSLILEAPFLKASRVFLTRNRIAQRLVAPTLPGRLSSIMSKIVRRLPVPGLKTFDHAFDGNGLQFEIAAATRAIRSGAREESRMPLSASIEALEIIEAIRAQPAS